MGERLRERTPEEWCEKGFSHQRLLAAAWLRTIRKRLAVFAQRMSGMSAWDFSAIAGISTKCCSALQEVIEQADMPPVEYRPVGGCALRSAWSPRAYAARLMAVAASRLVESASPRLGLPSPVSGGQWWRADDCRLREAR